MSIAAPTVPVPASTMDLNRWEIVRRRRRMLEGEWTIDIQQYMANFLAADRQAAWGAPSKSNNLFKSIIGQLAVLYDQDPVIRNDAMKEDEQGLLQGLNLFAHHRRHARYVLGLRESLIRIEWMPPTHVSKGGLSLRLVTPDSVLVTASSSAPSVPIKIEEIRLRIHPGTGKQDWYWDVWDITDPANPSFRILTNATEPGRPGIDVTAQFITDLEDLKRILAYLYRREDRTPYLPWVLYHAEQSGLLWSPDEWCELYHGSLEVALLWTFWIHSVKEASWQQRYGVDVTLQGLSTAGENDATRQRVTTDPVSILMFKSLDASKNGSLGQFAAPSDPKTLGEAIQSFQRTVANTVGIAPSDVQISQGESGVAIQLRRDGVRRMQAMFTPGFMAGDLELLEKAALIYNLFSEDGVLPIEGWSITYPSLPLSKEEMDDLLARNQQLIALGLKSKVDMYLELNPGVTRDEAKRRLLEIQAENAQFRLT